jgi:Peptidase_C39 like family/Tetratricopeptide repeat
MTSRSPIKAPPPRRRRNSQYNSPAPYGGLYNNASSNSQRLRPQRAGNGGGWMWGCLGLGVFSCAALCIIAALLTPIAFRQLPDDFQARIAARVPIFAAFLPTADRALEFIPTVDPARAATAAAAFANPANGGAPNIMATASVVFASGPGLRASPVLGVRVTPTPPPLISGGVAARPTATSLPLPVRYYVNNVQRVAQTWNNCGPANLVQALYVLGQRTDQATTAAYLKPNTNDSNVSPWQIVNYVNKFTDKRAVARVSGRLDLIKRLLYAGFPVILETGLYDHDDGSWLGHYVTIVGWDDLGEGQGGFFYGLDTYENNGPDGKGAREFYGDLDERWKHFNRVYIVIYPPGQENLVTEILGTAWDERVNLDEAAARAFAEAQQNPNDPFAWFNLGSSYVGLGRYDEAAVAYDRARSAGNGLPWRMLWYQFGPFKAYHAVREYTIVRDLANAVIGRTRTIEETFYYRGISYSALGVRDQALADLEYAVKLNGNLLAAQTALSQLQSGTQPVPEIL